SVTALVCRSWSMPPCVESLLACEQAAQPNLQPRPDELPDIERRAGRVGHGRAAEPRVEIGGELADQAVAELLRQARARELGERALQIIFDGQRHAGLPPAVLRGQAIGDLALGARAGAAVVAGAANDAAHTALVALDRGGTGEAGM